MLGVRTYWHQVARSPFLPLSHDLFLCPCIGRAQGEHKMVQGRSIIGKNALIVITV